MKVKIEAVEDGLGVVVADCLGYRAVALGGDGSSCTQASGGRVAVVPATFEAFVRTDKHAPDVSRCAELLAAKLRADLDAALSRLVLAARTRRWEPNQAWVPVWQGVRCEAIEAGVDDTRLTLRASLRVGMVVLRAFAAQGADEADWIGLVAGQDGVLASVADVPAA